MFFLQQSTIIYLYSSKQRFLVVKYCVVDTSVCTKFVFALLQFAILMAKICLSYQKQCIVTVYCQTLVDLSSV